MAFLSCHEIASVWMHPEAYAPLLGGEGPVAGIWYYASERAFLLHSGLGAVWFLAGMLLCLGRGLFKRPKLLVVHALLTVIWLDSVLIRWN